MCGAMIICEMAFGNYLLDVKRQETVKFARGPTAIIPPQFSCEWQALLTDWSARSAATNNQTGEGVVVDCRTAMIEDMIFSMIHKSMMPPTLAMAPHLLH